MMENIDYKVKYFNEHIADGDNSNICKWITHYLHTAYTYRKQNWDGSWLIIQPGWPEETVVSYEYYYEPTERYRHRSRLMLHLASNCVMDISLYKFKEFVRERMTLCNISQ